MRSVSRASPATTAHASVVGLPDGAGEALVVIGSEEGLEAGGFGAARDRQLLVVAEPLLGFGHQREAHGRLLRFARQSLRLTRLLTVGRLFSAMATIGAPKSTATTAELDAIVAGVHDMIAGFRCAGTGRLVKAGVSMTHMHVMWLLQHHGDLSMSHLAELLDVSFSNATGIIDRMEERGLVERMRVPDDRRVVLVRIAPRRYRGARGDGVDQARSAPRDPRPPRCQRRPVVWPPPSTTSAALVVAEFGPDFLAGHDHAHHRSPKEGTNN